jgi:tetratricopeptide (TPR) repeat protein
MDAVTHRLMASSGRMETLEVESLVSRDADYMAGVQAMAAENHAKAYESFHRVLNRYPTSRSALTKLLASLAEKFPNSMEIREQSMNVVHNPASVDAWMCLGQALQESHLPQEASFAYKQALLVDDQYAIAWHALGLALKEQGNSGEAVAAFRRAAEENPHYLASWNSLISTLSELGRSEDAITLCSMAVEKNPQDPSIWSRYGITLLASGLKEDAVGALKKAVDLDPMHREAWTNLAKVYEMLGQNEAARNAAEQVSLLKRDS